jgi:hypothetical protein
MMNKNDALSAFDRSTSFHLANAPLARSSPTARQSINIARNQLIKRYDQPKPVIAPKNPYVNSPPLGAQQRVSAPSTTRPSNTGMPNAPSSVRTLNLRQLANERLMQEQANVDRENQKRMLGYIQSVKPFASEFESRYGGQATAPTGYLDQVSGAKYDPVSVDKKYEEYARTVDPQAEILDPRIYKVKPGFGSPNFGFSAQVPSWLLGR